MLCDSVVKPDIGKDGEKHAFTYFIVLDSVVLDVKTRPAMSICSNHEGSHPRLNLKINGNKLSPWWHCWPAVLNQSWGHPTNILANEWASTFCLHFQPGYMLLAFQVTLNDTYNIGCGEGYKKNKANLYILT